MAAETLLIPGLLEAMGLTAAASAKKVDVPEGYVPGKGLAKIAKSLKEREANNKLMTDEEFEKLQEKYSDDYTGSNGKKPDGKDKAAKAAAATEGANKLKNKIGEAKERANFTGEPAYLEGKELEYAKRLKNARNNAKRMGTEIEISESQIMGGPKKKPKLISKHSIDATRKNPVPVVDDRKMASELNQYTTSIRAKATDKKPIEQRTSDILNDRTRQDMTHTYPTKEAPKTKGIKEELSPSFDKLFAIGIPGLLAQISAALPLGGASVEEISDIEDYLKELQKYANSDKPEDKEIFEQMLKEYEKETGHKLFEDLEDKDEKKDKDKKLSPKPELLDRV